MAGINVDDSWQKVFAKFPPAAHRGRGIRNDSQSEGSPFLSCLGENVGPYFLMQHFLNARN